MGEHSYGIYAESDGGTGNGDITVTLDTTGPPVVTAAVSGNALTIDANAGSDTLSGFENVTGSGFNDKLTGSAGNNVINGLDQFEPDYSVWGLGYDYPFSRRTNMYIGYAQREWDGRVTQAGGSALPQASQIFDRRQFAIGLRHLF